MPKSSKKSKASKPKKPTPREQRVGMSIFQVEPDLAGMAGTYKISQPKKRRFSSGVEGTGNRRFNGGSKKRAAR